MYVSENKQTAPDLCLVMPGSDCEQQATPNESVLESNVSGVYLVAENGFRTRVQLDWGIK